MMPSGHKAFLVNNTKDLELLMMHNRTYAAEYVPTLLPPNPSNPCQDRLGRLCPQAYRHHCPREAIRRQGHQLQGQGHDRGLNDELKTGVFGGLLIRTTIRQRGMTDREVVMRIRICAKLFTGFLRFSGWRLF